MAAEAASAPKLPNGEVEELLKKFRGKVTTSAEDLNRSKIHSLTDIKGDHILLYPATGDGDKDVVTAVRLAHVLGSKMLVRSGTHPACDDGEDGEGAVVVNLKNFKSISFTGATVRVGAAATTTQLAEELGTAKLFLPLDEMPKSVLSNALSTEPGYFGRSVGKLRDRVARFEGIGTAGRRFKAAKDGTKEEQHTFDGIMSGRTRAIITWMEMEALTEAEAKQIHMQRLHLPYEPAVFGAVLELVFSEWHLPERCDVMVRAFTAARTSTAFLTAVSNDPAVEAELQELMTAVKKRLGQLDPPLPEECGVHFVERQGAEMLELVAAAGLDALYQHDASRHRFYKKVGAEDVADFLELNGEYSTAVATALQNRACMRASTTVQFCGPETAVSISLFAPSSGQEANAVRMMLHFMEEPEPEQPAKRRKVDKLAPPSVSQVQKETAPIAHEVMRVVRAKSHAAIIPDFFGDIFPCGSDDYREHNHQYASSSYPADRMTPYMIACPTSRDDVQAAVRYAVAQNLKVVARSGGHQYCGLSSGGQDTLLLSMEHMHSACVKRVGNVKIATEGPGSALTDLAATLTQHHVVLPHGECPRVCIGGHVQTGGYGHIQRGFGLNLDHVLSFDIVTVDGKWWTIRRPGEPTEPGDNVHERNDEMFWGVLGGGPGSFGIVTEIRHKCIRDEDHPNSAGYSCSMLYEKKVSQAVLEQVMGATKGVVDGKLNPGKDIFVSILSCSLWNPTHPAVIVLEMVDSNPGGAAEEVPDQPFQDVVDRVDEAKSWWNRAWNRVILPPDVDGKCSLSHMNNSFVRRSGMTKDGREFKYPYKKRLNCTTKPLTIDFVKDFVNLVDEVVNDHDVKFVSQMNMGGAKYKNPTCGAGITSIAHRDMVFALVFDVFYTPGHEDKAVQYQAKMEGLLKRHWYGPDSHNKEAEIRMQWGSFDDTDMSKQTIQDYYYGGDDFGREKYKRLQKLKKLVDPNDTFHTQFTVQLPEQA